MKKILPALVILSFLVVPMLIFATGPKDQCTLRHDVSDIDPACIEGATVSELVTTSWGMCCMLDAVYTTTDWLFVVLIAFVAIMIIWGGVSIVTAGNNPEKVNTGRSYIMFAAIGLAVAFLARAIPSIVRALLGM